MQAWSAADNAQQFRMAHAGKTRKVSLRQPGHKADTQCSRSFCSTQWPWLSYMLSSSISACQRSQAGTELCCTKATLCKQHMNPLDIPPIWNAPKGDLLQSSHVF